jgi:bifunctional oligoribonuclease and PAP phosphatase NrnA
VLKQTEPGEWSVSLRSQGAVDVSAVAASFGGGGHRRAAGFTASGNRVEVVEEVRERLDRHLTR